MLNTSTTMAAAACSKPPAERVLLRPAHYYDNSLSIQEGAKGRIERGHICFSQVACPPAGTVLRFWYTGGKNKDSPLSEEEASRFLRIAEEAVALKDYKRLPGRGFEFISSGDGFQMFVRLCICRCIYEIPYDAMAALRLCDAGMDFYSAYFCAIHTVGCSSGHEPSYCSLSLMREAMLGPPKRQTQLASVRTNNDYISYDKNIDEATALVTELGFKVQNLGEARST